MDTDTGAGSPASEGSADTADTAPLPVLNALPGMLSDPGPFAPSEQDFGQPPFVEQPASPDPYWSALLRRHPSSPVLRLRNRQVKSRGGVALRRPPWTSPHGRIRRPREASGR